VTPHTRPKLELKKRSEALPEVAAPAAAEQSTAKSNPFGAAKPIDAEARIREVEARRAALKKEQEEAEKKEQEEKKVKEEADKVAAAEKLEAEKAAAAAAPLKVDTEVVEKEKADPATRPEKSITSPREPRDFGNRGNFRSERGDRADRGDRQDRGDRGDRGARPAPGGGGAWRRGPDRPAGQDRRTSRDDSKTEASPRDAAKGESTEPKAETDDGWSIAINKKGRGGSKAANS
jgi:translation initiation factor 4B